MVTLRLSIAALVVAALALTTFRAPETASGQAEAAPADGAAGPALALSVTASPASVVQGGTTELVVSVGSSAASIFVFATGPNGEAPDCTPPFAGRQVVPDPATRRFTSTCTLDRVGRYMFNAQARQPGSADAFGMAEVQVIPMEPHADRRCGSPLFKKQVHYSKACTYCSEGMYDAATGVMGMGCSSCCGACDGLACCGPAVMMFNSTNCHMEKRHIKFDKCERRLVCTRT